MAISTAAAVIGSSVLGAAGSAYASRKASKAQDKATKEAANIQREALARQEELTRPYREQGIEAQNALARMAGLGPDTGAPDYGVLGRPFGENELVVDPGYAFRLKEGMRDLDRRLSAGGRMFSGGALKAGQQYGQELASQEYQNAFTRAMELRMQRGNALSGLYGGGLQAAMGFGQDVGQSARNVGDLVTSGGAARASGYIGQANALNQAIGTGANYLVQRDLLNRIYPTGGAGGASVPSGVGAQGVI
jgi:hypothetical protein